MDQMSKAKGAEYGEAISCRGEASSEHGVGRNGGGAADIVESTALRSFFFPQYL
jgi:hypothetical protein